jgi:1,4-dihydroxy-2-naphthoate polyprenyltransferase
VIIAVGAASILAGVLYTGGPWPYGYAGLGEVFVFLFFGLVAVTGSYYVQLERLDWLPFALSVAVGCLSTAILVVNNIRDIDTDRRAGKRTLAVRIGRKPTRAVYIGLLLVAFFVGLVALITTDAPWWGGLLLAAVWVLLSRPPAQAVARRTDGPSLNKALAQTGALLGMFSLALSAALIAA